MSRGDINGLSTAKEMMELVAVGSQHQAVCTCVQSTSLPIAFRYLIDDSFCSINDTLLELCSFLTSTLPTLLPFRPGLRWSAKNNFSQSVETGTLPARHSFCHLTNSVKALNNDYTCMCMFCECLCYVVIFCSVGFAHLDVTFTSARFFYNVALCA